MHVDEFIFNCCVSSMISSENVTDASEECAMNVFSIDENKIRDANGIIFAEAITCYKCTFCGKMFAAMEVVLTHYQSNHRCSVIPLLKGMKLSTSKIKTQKMKATVDQTPLKPNRRGRPSKDASKEKAQQTPSTTKLSYSLSPKILPKQTMSTMPVSRSRATFLKKLRPQTVKVMYTDSKKKYRCKYKDCTKRYSTYSSLISHRKTHSNDKSFYCDWNDCHFRCADQSGLEFHKNTHFGDNPYKCSWPGCDQSFADSVAKETHLQIIHIGNRTLQCDYPFCNETFSLSTERDKHRAKLHGKNYLTAGKKAAVVQSSDSEEDFSDDDNTDDDEDEEEDDTDNDDDIKVVNTVKAKHEDDVKVIKIIKSKPDTEDTSKSKEDAVKSMHESRDEKRKVDEIEVNNDQNSESNNSSKIINGDENIPKRRKSISKTKFRCDYPGCRKTFTSGDVLKEHEIDAHKTNESDGRHRYERKCKGNLYYKI